MNEAWKKIKIFYAHQSSTDRCAYLLVFVEINPPASAIGFSMNRVLTRSSQGRDRESALGKHTRTPKSYAAKKYLTNIKNPLNRDVTVVLKSHTDIHGQHAKPKILYPLVNLDTHSFAAVCMSRS